MPIITVWFAARLVRTETLDTREPGRGITASVAAVLVTVPAPLLTTNRVAAAVGELHGSECKRGIRGAGDDDACFAPLVR